MKKALLIACCLSLIAVVAVFHTIEEKMNEKLLIEEAELITISSGASINKLINTLQAKGWVSEALWLKLYVRLNPDKALVKKGTYQVQPNSSLVDILTLITEGKEYQYSVTFIEGTRLQEWLWQVQELPGINQVKETASPEALAKALGISQRNPEGWFFPETYSYTNNTSSLEIFARAHTKMKRVLNEEWQARASDLPYKNAYQALIMASIIEKETGLIEEQPQIASVFINRLEKNMRLQTDPTVIYGVREVYKGDITRAHLKDKNEYNTYVIKGLPPTPIAMPGLTAIKASLNPDQTPYYYFVSRGDGSHKFSKTNAEHNKAVAKYILGKN